RLVDHIADINLTYSDIAREYLVREGLPPDRIIKTGSPMYEVLNYFRPQIESSDVLARLHLTPPDFFVVSAHREENVDDPRRLQALFDTLQAIATEYQKRFIFSTHPRTRSRLQAAGMALDPRVELLTPLGFHDYVHLQQ